MAGNVHEEYARARKISALVEELDRVAALSGISPFSLEMLRFVRSIEAETWRATAVSLGHKPPSAETIRQIETTYLRRVESAAAQGAA